MNSSSFVRSLLAKKMTGEKFLLHVLQMVERQLQEWDDYHLIVMKFRDYEILITCGNQEIEHIIISEQRLAELQQKSPYSLDLTIWEELLKKGINIKKDGGSYLRSLGFY